MHWTFIQEVKLGNEKKILFENWPYFSIMGEFAKIFQPLLVTLERQYFNQLRWDFIS
jgi:hypothetical protein